MSPLLEGQPQPMVNVALPDRDQQHTTERDARRRRRERALRAASSLAPGRSFWDELEAASANQEVSGADGNSGACVAALALCFPPNNDAAATCCDSFKVTAVHESQLAPTMVITYPGEHPTLGLRYPDAIAARLSQPEESCSSGKPDSSKGEQPKQDSQDGTVTARAAAAVNSAMSDAHAQEVSAAREVSGSTLVDTDSDHDEEGLSTLECTNASFLAAPATAENPTKLLQSSKHSSNFGGSASHEDDCSVEPQSSAASPFKEKTLGCDEHEITWMCTDAHNIDQEEHQSATAGVGRACSNHAVQAGGASVMAAQSNTAQPTAVDMMPSRPIARPGRRLRLRRKQPQPHTAWRRSQTSVIRTSIGHILKPAEQGSRILVEGDGWGGGRDSYEAIVTEADAHTFTVIRLEGRWEENHVRREYCHALPSSKACIVSDRAGDSSGDQSAKRRRRIARDLMYS